MRLDDHLEPLSGAFQRLTPMLSGKSFDGFTDKIVIRLRRISAEREEESFESD